LVLIILAVVWAAVLLPPFLQNRSESRPADSISTFRSQLSVLERRSVGTTHGSAEVPRSVRPLAGSPFTAAPVRRASVDHARLARMAAKKRRRDILLTLLAAAGITLVGSILSPQVLVLHLVVDVLLAAYVFLLVRQRKLAEQRSMTVRYLSDAQARRQPAPARRAGTAPVALRAAAAN
jgi:hypothetical protein